MRNAKRGMRDMSRPTPKRNTDVKSPTRNENRASRTFVHMAALN